MIPGVIMYVRGQSLPKWAVHPVSAFPPVSDRTADMAGGSKGAKNRHVTTASGCSFHVINGVAARLKVQDVTNQGGDTVLAYTGTYFKNGDRFSASVRTQRHSLGQPSVFGIDNLDLTLTGKSTPSVASCTGTARQAPDMMFVAALVPMAD